MTTTTDKTYLISNTHLDVSFAKQLSHIRVYGCTWILFAETPIIEWKSVHSHVHGRFRPAFQRIEVYKYVDGPGATQTKSKVVAVDEARAEWRFWIGQGFQRITDITDKGWKYTEDMRKPFPLSAYLSARKRCVVEKMVNGIKIKSKETA